MKMFFTQIKTITILFMILMSSIMHGFHFPKRLSRIIDGRIYYRTRTQLKCTDNHLFSEMMDFGKLGVSKTILQLLNQQGFITPTNIQSMSFLPIYNAKDCVIGAETGSNDNNFFS